jgi:hypothetical protein
MCFRPCQHSDCVFRRSARRHGRHAEFIINRHTHPTKHPQPKHRAPLRSAGSSAPLRRQLRSAPPAASLRSASSFAATSPDNPVKRLRPAASPDVRAATVAEFQHLARTRPGSLKYQHSLRPVSADRFKKRVRQQLCQARVCLC